MDIALDRLGALVDQFDSSRDLARERIDGLSDDEYRWEPVPGMWSVRRRGEAAGPNAYGPGEWVIDHEPDPADPPLTTIAWRLAHLTNCLDGRWEWTFGERSTHPRDCTVFTPSAGAALEALDASMARWRAGLVTLTDEQLEVPGFGQYPWGLDPEIPFLGIVWWVNREVIAHLAEVCLLRDLYRAQRPAADR